MHTSGYGKYLGRINVVFDSGGEVRSFGGDPIVLDHSRKEDPALRAVVDQYRAEIDKKMNVAVGRSLAYIDGGRPGCRLYECAFGDLATDAMAAEMNVEMAILNSGAIKGSFNAGELNTEYTISISDTNDDAKDVFLRHLHQLVSWGAEMIPEKRALPRTFNLVVLPTFVT